MTENKDICRLIRQAIKDGNRTAEEIRDSIKSKDNFGKAYTTDDIRYNLNILVDRGIICKSHPVQGNWSYYTDNCPDMVKSVVSQRWTGDFVADWSSL